ncbi:hypothetical protein F4801DRAFT_488806 [Xylaria longipes]|nr:hypothetical protein F4801DRAFT_488806 [Xylaria longipes]
MPRSVQPSFSPRAVGGRRFVAFFHPAYPDPSPPLLTLAAVDYVREGAQVVKGIDYDTAKAACGIIACNRFDDDAYFALKSSQGGWARFERPADGLLRANGDFTFYFVVDSPNWRYPVVPSFDHWRFPHGELPPRWASLSVPSADDDNLGSGVGDRDRDGASEPLCFKETEFARIAPFSHLSWGDSNQMEKYCRRHGVGVTGVSPLFTDIRRCFPPNLMDSIPDLYGRDYRPNRFELHPELILHDVLDAAIHSRTVWRDEDHQNEPIRIDGIHREHLFARFAFHVLSDANYRFLGGALKYTVRLFDVDKAEQYTAELYSDDITERSCIFAPPFENGIPQDDEYDESDESYEDSHSSSSEGARSLRYPRHTSEHRTGRTRYRSPGYYEYRRRWEASWQDQDDADHPDHAELMQDRQRSHHASSIGGVSLSSTLSISSLETPRTGRTPEGAAGHEDQSSSFHDEVHSKRPYDDYSETQDTSRSPKRLRLG